MRVRSKGSTVLLIAPAGYSAWLHPDKLNDFEGMVVDVANHSTYLHDGFPECIVLCVYAKRILSCIKLNM